MKKKDRERKRVEEEKRRSKHWQWCWCCGICTAVCWAFVRACGCSSFSHHSSFFLFFFFPWHRNEHSTKRWQTSIADTFIYYAVYMNSKNMWEDRYALMCIPISISILLYIGIHLMYKCMWMCGCVCVCLNADHYLDLHMSRTMLLTFWHIFLVLFNFCGARYVPFSCSLSWDDWLLLILLGFARLLLYIYACLSNIAGLCLSLLCCVHPSISAIMRVIVFWHHEWQTISL